MQSVKRVVDNKEFSANFRRVFRHPRARHHPGRRSASQSPGNKTVSIVTRTAYGDKQFSGPDSA